MSVRRSASSSESQVFTHGGSVGAVCGIRHPAGPKPAGCYHWRAVENALWRVACARSGKSARKHPSVFVLGLYSCPQRKNCKFNEVCFVSFCREIGIIYKIIRAKLTILSMRGGGRVRIRILARSELLKAPPVRAQVSKSLDFGHGGTREAASMNGLHARPRCIFRLWHARIQAKSASGGLRGLCPEAFRITVLNKTGYSKRVASAANSRKEWHVQSHLRCVRVFSPLSLASVRRGLYHCPWR